MFLGHRALACALRPRLERPGLGTLMLATSWPDLLRPVLLLAGGVALHLRGTTPRDRAGRVSIGAFVAFVAAVCGADTLAGAPPPSARAVAWVGLASWLLPAWGAWIERTRVRRVTGSRECR